MPLHEALLKAGRTRFRPILMTSLCTILGLVAAGPGHGTGRAMQQPLAIAVIGGLITNMLLTRLLIPVGYLVLVGQAGGGPGVTAEPFRAGGVSARILVVEDQLRHLESLAARPGGRGI